MPTAADLPADLRDLAFRNAVELSHARWLSDLSLLLASLQRLGVAAVLADAWWARDRQSALAQTMAQAQAREKEVEQKAQAKRDARLERVAAKRELAAARAQEQENERVRRQAL